MYQNLVNKSILFRILFKLDELLATETHEQGCPCGGSLHRADYPRKPRGGPVEYNRAYMSRRSFCCSREGCRRRMTPPSMLFLGRKVYFAAAIVVVCVLRQEPTPKRLDDLRELVGVNPQTIRRWLKWWREEFARSGFWTAARGRFRARLNEAELPQSLLEAFEVKGKVRKLVHLLRFVGPVTTAQSSLAS